MPSDGETFARVEAALRIVRSAIDIGTPAEQAFNAVPADIRDDVQTLWERQDIEADENPTFVTFRRVVKIFEPKAGPRPWFEEYDPAKGYHWRRLRSWLLQEKGYNARVVDSLDEASDTILAHLEDPSPNGSGTFRIQGLVLGRVQSGMS